MKQKKVMIVGAGIGQVNLLKICQKRDYDVFVVSIPGDYPCFKLTDNIRYADITDKEAVLKIAQEEKIDAVLSDQSDMAVATVAYVAEKMHLRGIGYDTSLKFTNKYFMRQAAQKAGIGVPDFARVKTLQEALAFSNSHSYPLIIKPVDGWSSRGVHKVNNDQELTEHFQDSLCYSISGYAIIESFVTGKEYLADGFAMDNKYTNLDVGEKEYFDIPNIFVSKMCMFSSAAMANGRVEKMVLDANKKLVENMGLSFGITHAEYLYSPQEDKVYLVEIAARGGGVYLSTDITPKATGFHTNEALVDYVVEGKLTVPVEQKLTKCVSAWICIGFPEGEIVSIKGAEEVKQLPGVYKVLLDKVYVGMQTQEISNDNNKYGPILIAAQTKQVCHDIIEKVLNILDIRVKTKNGIEKLVW